jgi:hypothetical protein
VYASIAWGVLAVVAGALISHTSVRWGILAYACFCVPCFWAAWNLNPGPRRPAAAAQPTAPGEAGEAGEAGGFVGSLKSKLAAKAAAQLEDDSRQVGG